MASSINLEERFNLAVRTIQNLPSDGILQLSNLTKLIFYGLYKQATLGPCKESQPSMFNYVARAKWEAWDRCRTMTKEQAMLGYIDEIRKIVEKMPQTDEVLAFAKSMGVSKELVDDQPKANDSLATTDNDFTQIVVAAKHDSSPSLSSTSSSISSSDIDEFYDDPSDLLSMEMASNQDFQQPSTNTARLHPSPPPQMYGVQNGTTVPLRHSTQGGNNHSNVSPFFHPTNDYNRETQRAILTALTKLQRDIHNILQRLNRLETSANLLQQRELSMSLELNSSLKWFPLSGFRRGAIAFILLWPFIAFLLIRLYLRARIIIRFRR